MKRTIWGLFVLSLIPVTAALAQPASAQQEDPLAAAARQAREEKKQQAKPGKVWDNDNIPKNAGALSVVGQSAQENAAPGDTSANSGNKAAADGSGKLALTPAEQKAVVEQDLNAAKEELQNLQSDFDILQRKHTLDQQMYLSKPDYSSDKAGAAALQDEQDQIDAKQQEMIAAQQKVADLQAKLNAANPENKSNPQ